MKTGYRGHEGGSPVPAKGVSSSSTPANPSALSCAHLCSLAEHCPSFPAPPFSCTCCTPQPMAPFPAPTPPRPSPVPCAVRVALFCEPPIPLNPTLSSEQMACMHPALLFLGLSPAIDRGLFAVKDGAIFTAQSSAFRPSASKLAESWAGLGWPRRKVRVPVVGMGLGDRRGVKPQRSRKETPEKHSCCSAGPLPGPSSEHAALWPSPGSRAGSGGGQQRWGQGATVLRVGWACLLGPP